MAIIFTRKQLRRLTKETITHMTKKRTLKQISEIVDKTILEIRSGRRNRDITEEIINRICIKNNINAGHITRVLHLDN